MLNTTDIVRKAHRAQVAIPAFNVPYLPMIAPIIRAVRDEDSIALIEVARLEWMKFESRSPAAVMEEFLKWRDRDHVRIHLDHVPVIDEDNLAVDYIPIIEEAIELGYESVMVDGSRLGLDANIQATAQVVGLAHQAGLPCEAELGAVLGHETGPIPSYEELYESGRGFTDVDEAARFTRETGCDWLSVASGNVHGAVSAGLRDREKVEARLSLEHLENIANATEVPLVLHGGSGIKPDCVLGAIKRGIAKINIGTELRQTYQRTLKTTGSAAKTQEAVYRRTRWLVREYLHVSGMRSFLSTPRISDHRIPTTT